MKLLVYEHVAGGGFADEKISSNILSEGYGMLRALISDFKAAGHDVTTSLDSRLTIFNPPIEVDDVIPISSHEELKKTLERLSQSVDAVYIIAPESGQVLQRLVETVEMAGGISLNCQVDAIKKASNKIKVYKTLKKIGLPVPETLIISLHEDIRQIKYAVGELGFPLVFKPVDGVGCRGLSVVRNENQITAAVDKIIGESPGKYFLAQRLIKGTAASVSLISTGEEALPVTLNKQTVTLALPNSDSSYTGGIIPLHHPLIEEALETTRKVAGALRDLRGYIGVDIVLTRDEPVVMEVNPRLTTSYVGLRTVMNFNIAQAIIDAVLKRKLPENVQNAGYTFFSKMKVSVPSREVLQETYRLGELISPPFPVADNRKAYALIVAYSAKFKDARTRLYETRRHLLDILSRGD